MISPRFTRIATLAGCTACVGVIAGIVGCSEEAAPAPVVRTVAPPPAPPPRPAVTPIADLMQLLGIDERVRLAEADAPATDIERKAVLEFFDAFARQDAKVLETRLALAEQYEIRNLVASGAWEEVTANIDRIVIETGHDPSGQPVSLAVFWVGDEFQPQMWFYRTDGLDPIFNAAATPPDVMNRLHGSDLIAEWFRILEEEWALADAPDEEFRVDQVVLVDDSADRSSGAGPGGVGPNPMSPGGGGPNMPGRREKPKGPPRAPPGPGG